MRRIEIRDDKKPRGPVTPKRRLLLAAILRVLEDLNDYLPVSQRQIHYNLLNDPRAR